MDRTTANWRSMTGLRAGLSAAMRRRRFDPVYDQGQVFPGLALMLILGGEAISDFQGLRHPAPVIGPVASTPTVWRALSEAGELQLARRSTRDLRGPAVRTHLAVGGNDVHPIPRRLQWKLPGRCGDWLTPPPSPPRPQPPDFGLPALEAMAAGTPVVASAAAGLVAAGAQVAAAATWERAGLALRELLSCVARGGPGRRHSSS